MKLNIERCAKLSRAFIDHLLAEEFVLTEVGEHRALWFGSVLTFSDAQLAQRAGRCSGTISYGVILYPLKVGCCRLGRGLAQM